MHLWAFYFLGCAVVCCLLGLLWEERPARAFFGAAGVVCLLLSGVASNWLVM